MKRGETRRIAEYRTSLRGGKGAERLLIEL